MAKGNLLHDVNARNDEKVVVLRQQLGSEGYGNFWMLNEIMRTATENKLLLSRTSAYAFSCAVPATQFEQVIECAIELQLYQSDGVSFWSNRLVKDAIAYKQTCETNAQNGSKGGRGKRAQSERKAGAKRPPSGPLPYTNLISGSEDGDSKGEEPIQLTDRIAVSKPEHAALLAEFGAASVAHHAPIATDWLKSKGVVMKDYAAFLRNWIRKERTDQSGFYGMANRSKQLEERKIEAKKRADSERLASLRGPKDSPEKAQAVIDRVLENPKYKQVLRG